MRQQARTIAVSLAVLAAPFAARADEPAVADRGELMITFVLDEGLVASARAVGDAQLDVGVISAAWRPTGSGRRVGPQNTLIVRRVGVRVTSRTRRSGFVRLSAALSSPLLHGSLRIDGVPLSLAPRQVDALAPIGATVAHLMEFEVPPSAPPGAFASSIVWEVEEP